MSDFKLRLLEERDQLQEKVTKLDTFICSEAFKTVSDNQQNLLENQLIIMEDYLWLLNARLKDLDKN